MSKNLTPESFLKSFADELNKGNVGYLLFLYEADACFVSQEKLSRDEKTYVKFYKNSLISKAK